METLELGADELEALRLADLEGLYQEECARRMGISRTTFSRTLTQAHQTVADALVHGKRLVVAPLGETDCRPASGLTPVHQQTIEDTEERTMKKILLTANDDRGLDGEMAMHFGRCSYFVLAHVDGDNQVTGTEVHPNPYAERHEPGQIPRFIQSLGAEVVVAGGMGGKAIEWFRRLGIEVATSTRPGVAETLSEYLAGTLTGAVECQHEQ